MFIGYIEKSGKKNYTNFNRVMDVCIKGDDTLYVSFGVNYRYVEVRYQTAAEAQKVMDDMFQAYSNHEAIFEIPPSNWKEPAPVKPVIFKKPTQSAGISNENERDEFLEMMAEQIGMSYEELIKIPKGVR